jgi:nucleoside-diphosphate-sugar epimerase
VRVLVIGGTRFMGYHLTWKLLAAGHEVTLLNRGNHADPFGARVSRLRADRTKPEFFTVLAGREFDAAVDFAAYRGADAQGVIDALEGRVGHYVLISTGQVYLVRADPPVPAREEDYDGPLMGEPPPGHRDRSDWDYGMGKRACEDLLAEAWRARRFPSTRLRIPIVNGERDQSRRLESYLWRILDGGPLLLPDGGVARLRQVYSGAVVSTLLRVLGDRATFGQAYNVCQDETPTLAELIGLLAELLGAPARIVAVPVAEMEKAGLDPIAASPFSTRWKSYLDPARARRDLGLAHPSPRVYLDKTVASMLAAWPNDPPAGYAQRPREIEFAPGLSNLN